MNVINPTMRSNATMPPTIPPISSSGAPLSSDDTDAELIVDVLDIEVEVDVTMFVVVEDVIANVVVVVVVVVVREEHASRSLVLHSQMVTRLVEQSYREGQFET
jgi:hypothetical protein